MVAKFYSKDKEERTMKKYISPAMLTVQLSTTSGMMIGCSLVIDKSGSNTITEESQILTKENRDVNLWDEEW